MYRILALKDSVTASSTNGVHFRAWYNYAISKSFFTSEGHIMRNLKFQWLKYFLLGCLCVMVVGCSSKITQENFARIQNNMSMKDVIGILGEPTSSEGIMIAGISGTSAVWKSQNSEIDIQFLNDKVTVKSFNTIKEEDPHQGMHH